MPPLLEVESVSKSFGGVAANVESKTSKQPADDQHNHDNVN